MTVRPIIFSAPMIRALLAGKKTMTRRILKPQPPKECGITYMLGNESWLDVKDRTPVRRSWEAWGGPLFHSRPEGHMCGGFDAVSPYQPNDLLYVRESFWGCDMPGYGDQPCVVYDDERAPDGKSYHPAYVRPWAKKFGRIPAIYMPRDTSRLTLKVTNVNIERVQDISHDDAIAEGVPSVKDFAAIWTNIHDPNAWVDNPWVVAVRFTVHKINVDDMLGETK